MTIKDYLTWAEKLKERMIASGHYGSEPTPLFLKETDDPEEYWVFNRDNWNGGDILRKWFYNDWNQKIHFHDYIIKYYWIDDQTTIYILGENEWYEISWYKNRGRTEEIKRNGHDIELGEYIDLCNYLGIVLEDKE